MNVCFYSVRLACPGLSATTDDGLFLLLKRVCSCFGAGAGKGQKLQKNIITQLLHLECHRVRRRPMHCSRARPQVSATRSGRGKKAIHCCVCQQSEQPYSRTLNSKLSAEPIFNSFDTHCSYTHILRTCQTSVINCGGQTGTG